MATLADLLASQDPADQELAQKMLEQQAYEQSQLNSPTDGYGSGVSADKAVADYAGQSFQPMTGGSQPVPLGLNAFKQAAYRRQSYGPGDSSPVPRGTGSFQNTTNASQEFTQPRPEMPVTESQSGTIGAPVQIGAPYAPRVAANGEYPGYAQPTPQSDAAAGIEVLQSVQRADGKLWQMVKAPAIDGEGRQTMQTQFREVLPSAIDPMKMADMKMQKGQADINALSPKGIEEAARSKKAGEDAANVERRARLTPAQRAAEDYRATGGKLAVDQEVDPETGAVRAKVGSKLYQTQKNAHAADLNAAAVVGDSVDAAVKKIDRVLKDEDGFTSMFGGYNAKYGTQFLPGAQDTKLIIDSLKADMKKAGLEIMRSGGSIGMMTEREWPIVEAQIAAIDPLLSESEARAQLQAVADRLNTIKMRAADKYKTEWSEHPFYKGAKPAPDAAPKMGMVKNGYVFLGGDPSKQTSWMRQ